MTSAAPSASPGARSSRASARSARAVLRHDLEHPPVERDRALGRAERLLLEHRPLGEQLELRAPCSRARRAARRASADRRAGPASRRMRSSVCTASVVALVLLDERAVRRHGLVDPPELARVDLGELRAQDAHLLAAAFRRSALLLLLLLASARVALERRRADALSASTKPAHCAAARAAASNAASAPSRSGASS